jgi:septal ring factor EnvC (AmiA/AmiB activator)
MNAKRWFAWVCLALMLVAEVLLFRANHARDQAQTDWRDALHQLHDAQKELAELKNSASGEQAATVLGLRKQNEALTTKVNALQKDVTRLEADRQQTAQHLDTARDALALQQASLEKLQLEKERAAAVANAAACIRNLRQIDAAKLQWAVDKAKSATDVPTPEDLAPYFRDGNFPACPDGGTYAINAVGELPTCTIAIHVLPSPPQ